MFQKPTVTNRSRERFITRLVVFLFIALMASVPAFAQGTRGTIRGQVTDPNGAVVTGATVKLFDFAKQTEVRSIQTNEAGEYQFLEIEPSVYNVIITAGGFAEARLTEVKVEPNRDRKSVV